MTEPSKIEKYTAIATTWADHFCVDGDNRKILIDAYVHAAKSSDSGVRLSPACKTDLLALDASGQVVRLIGLYPAMRTALLAEILAQPMSQVSSRKPGNSTVTTDQGNHGCF